MPVFTVHQPAGLTGRGERAADQVVFVKDGFGWPALFVPVLWLVYHGMWLILIGYVLIATGLEAAGWMLGNGSLVPFVLGAAFTLFFAFEANELRRWHLSRKGYQLVGVTVARNRTECERRFFETWLERGAPPPPPPRPAPVRPAAAPGVIGVFPEDGRG